MGASWIRCGGRTLGRPPGTRARCPPGAIPRPRRVVNWPTGGKAWPMRIVVADESPMFTRGLSLLLPPVSERRGDVTASTDDAPSAAAVVRRSAPDLALISLGLAEPGGLRAIAATHRAEPQVAILAMSPADATAAG